jgi:hypothetical protein
LLIGPSQLQTEQQGHTHPDDTHNNSRNQELLGDHLVIHRENVLADERFLVMVVVGVVIGV